MDNPRICPYYKGKRREHGQIKETFTRNGSERADMEPKGNDAPGD